MENLIEIENDMNLISNKVVTSSPAKDSHDESSIDVEFSPFKGDKSDKDMSLSLRIDANESTDNRTHVTNGLLTFSTPLQNSNRFQYNNNLSAFQIYRNLMVYNSTPKSNEKMIRKPRVNFHSIDDIVYGGKNTECDISNYDSGYQSNSIANLSNSASFQKSTPKKITAQKVIEESENNSDHEANNDENIETKSKSTTNTNNNNSNKKIRTTFSDNQKWMLEQYYRRNAYPDPRETEDLSKQLSLPENVIKVWFQNKRSRDKQRKSSNKTTINSDFATQLNNLQLFTNALAPYASIGSQVIGGFY